MFAEERAALGPLPLEPFRHYRREERTEVGELSLRMGVCRASQIRAAGRVFRSDIDTGVNPNRNALCLL
jgi:hypothetical protein